MQTGVDLDHLKAIPCIAGPADPSNPLHNDCP